MLTAGLIALARFGGFRLGRGGAHDGLALLLIGLAVAAVAIWALSTADGRASAKNHESTPGR
jgi:hypothetical protein